MKKTYTIKEIAYVLDLTERRVQMLAKEGLLPKTKRGKYELYSCTRSYIKYLREKINLKEREKNFDFDFDFSDLK